MDHAAALTEQNGLLAQLYRAADPDTEVPMCPGWTLRKLVTHVGRGDRWAATIVRERSDTYVDIRTVAGGRAPDDQDGVAEWLRAGAAELLAAVASTGPDAPVWTFTGPKPAQWWIRRRLHEATVHRADAALALGEDYDLAPALAADGVSEWLGLLAARRARDAAPPLAAGVTLHLHATEPGSARPGSGWCAARRTGSSGSTGTRRGSWPCAARPGTCCSGCSAESRPTTRGCEVLGDAAIWRTWLARTGF